MSRTTDFRDYLYVSARKVVRMSRTLRTPIWKHVRDLQVKLGPIGTTLTLDTDSRAEDVITLVPEVENAIGERFGIKYITDPDLQVGEWFLIEGVPMIYGIPLTRPHSDRAVVFLGEEGSQFILGGSAEYLLDRRIAATKETLVPPSSFAGMLSILNSLQSYDHHLSSGQSESSLDARLARVRADPRNNWSYGFRFLEREFGYSPEPLTALVRCLASSLDDGKTTIIGTPLYVAFDVPR